MDKLLALTIEGYGEVQAPNDIPTGGWFTAEKALQNGIIITLILTVALSLAFFLWGAIKWITSEGDKGKIDAARKTIIYSVIGLILVILSFFIITMVGNVFGVDFFFGTSNPSDASSCTSQGMQYVCNASGECFCH